VVARLHEQRRSDGAVHAPGHRDENALRHLPPLSPTRNAEVGTRNSSGGSDRGNRPRDPTTARSVPPSAFRLPRWNHRCSTADSALTFSTILGSALTTASTSSAVLSRPKEKRNAAMPRSRGTPIAVSTCEGSIAPVLQADPEAQATPARSRCMSSASLSAAVDDRLHRPAIAHDEGADPFRRADLVPRDGD